MFEILAICIIWCWWYKATKRNALEKRIISIEQQINSIERDLKVRDQHLADLARRVEAASPNAVEENFLEEIYRLPDLRRPSNQ